MTDSSVCGNSVWTAENSENKRMGGEKARELIVKRPR